MLRASLALVRLRLELSKYQKMGSRVTSLGVFTISKHTISVADRKVGDAVLRSSGKAGCRAGFTIPVRNGQSRPVTKHRPPAWGQHGFFTIIKN